MSTVIDIINILPIPLFMITLFGSWAGVPDGIWGYVVCMAVSLWVLVLRGMTRKNRLLSIGVVAAFIAGIALVAGKENVQQFIEGNIWAFRIIGITAASLAAGMVAARYILIRRVFAVGMIVYCAVGTVLGWRISKGTFVTVGFVLLVRTAEEIQLRWKKSGCTDTGEHIARISPILLAVCIAVYALPAPSKPYDWHITKSIYSLIVSGINRVYGSLTHPFDDYGSIGFSDNGRFLSGLDGGGDEDVLIITSQDAGIRDFRIVGCISGEFTGRGWDFDDGIDSSSRMLDTMETVCAVMKYDPSYKNDYVRKYDMQCESLFYNTRYIFSPAKIRLESTIRKNLDMRKKDIDIKVKDMGISEKDGSIVTDMKLGYRDGYYVSCYVVNHGGRVMERLAENASPISEEEWEQTARNETVFGKDGFTYADLQSYHREVYEKYCRPCGVSDRVRELLDGIQEGAVTRYDTAARLQTYLSSMDYDAECGPLPDTVTDGRSFLDYFLLQSRRGYCMHYATAFVLMANEMGIPCRYVQGFNVRRENGAMNVRQSSAHAWPEVYFDDVGWIAFEPTPGFAVPTGWDVAERETDDIPDVPEPVTVDLPSLDYEEPIVEEKRIDPLIFIIPSLAVMVFLIAFYLISRAVSRRMYSRMSLCDRCRYTARQSIRILGILGFGMEEGETLAELRDRIAQSDRQDVSSLTGFIPIYEDVLYSERELTEEDAGTAEDMNIRLRALAKKGGLRSRILLMIRDR